MSLKASAIFPFTPVRSFGMRTEKSPCLNASIAPSSARENWSLSLVNADPRPAVRGCTDEPEDEAEGSIETPREPPAPSSRCWYKISPLARADRQLRVNLRWALIQKNAYQTTDSDLGAIRTPAGPWNWAAASSTVMCCADWI